MRLQAGWSGSGSCRSGLAGRRPPCGTLACGAVHHGACKQRVTTCECNRGKQNAGSEAPRPGRRPHRLECALGSVWAGCIASMPVLMRREARRKRIDASKKCTPSAFRRGDETATWRTRFGLARCRCRSGGHSELYRAQHDIYSTHHSRKQHASGANGTAGVCCDTRVGGGWYLCTSGQPELQPPA